VSQGIEDGYLAACEIVRRDIFLDQKSQSEQQTGIERADLLDKNLTNAITAEALDASVARERYEATSFEDRWLLPERVRAMAQDLFNQLLTSGALNERRSSSALATATPTTSPPR
jgi:type I restriction enzyme, R subunit